ncbi:CopG family transcriptional regulator [Clostridium oceanicum]|uniref:CopG family transcriptional regulator n=1 Tax=Clostridium oceanicum TaxID=1543 RepID=A0ABN1JAZ4_9CLOT
MSGEKKVVVNLSETLYKELDEILKQESKKKSEFFREAIILYIEKKKKLDQIEQMKKGYMEMAKINSDFAESGFVKDIEDLKKYEDMLSESDFPNDNYSEKRRYILC